ncbi:PorT family protein [Hymenobacter latericus]|uniref:PorT family protein n=1 Tax=Hymenobacter sp. YIM 151858-1 TaxID=2987688 RepID=UPI00222761ED|nr:PorT family protein [Hymenobacter sp. YIM 151858-1]UYZ60602.1 PorT family protein [Hymenobacter sp. YIM 151858-1]
MKKLLLLLLGLPLFSWAQTSPDSTAARPPAAWQGGLLIGHDLFRVTNPQPGFVVGQYQIIPRLTTPSAGFRIGFWARHNFGGPARRWFVQPELTYSRSQSWHHINNTARQPNSDDFWTMSSAQDWQRLNVALPVGYRLGKRVRLLGGAAFAVRIPTGYERAEQDYETRIVSSINHSMRRHGFALQAGVGYDAGRVLLTARYERGLTKAATEINLDEREYGFVHYVSQLSFGMALRLLPFKP